MAAALLADLVERAGVDHHDVRRQRRRVREASRPGRRRSALGRPTSGARVAGDRPRVRGVTVNRCGALRSGWSKQAHDPARVVGLEGASRRRRACRDGSTRAQDAAGAAGVALDATRRPARCRRPGRAAGGGRRRSCARSRSTPLSWPRCDLGGAVDERGGAGLGAAERDRRRRRPVVARRAGRAGRRRCRSARRRAARRAPRPRAGSGWRGGVRHTGTVALTGHVPPGVGLATPTCRTTAEEWPVRRDRGPATATTGPFAVRADRMRRPDDPTGSRSTGSCSSTRVRRWCSPWTTRSGCWCVRQYRHPAGSGFVELPAGLLDEPGEDPEEAARRELRRGDRARGRGRGPASPRRTASPGITAEVHPLLPGARPVRGRPRRLRARARGGRHAAVLGAVRRAARRRCLAAGWRRAAGQRVLLARARRPRRAE